MSEPVTVVSGCDADAVAAMREVLDTLSTADIEANVFRHPASRFVVRLEEVYRGSAFLRDLSLRLVGRPSVTAHFEFRRGAVTIEKTVSSSALFQDRRDVGFRGAALGGSNRAYIRTNCRVLIRKVVRDILNALGIPPSQQTRYFATLDHSPRFSRLRWVGFGAIVVGLPLGILADVAGRSSQKHLLAGIVLALGALLGGVVGWLAGAATSVIRRLRRRLTARGRREPAGA